ncbi:hypothetical protein Tco_1174696 [Tanacetum coccineum]
MATVPGTNKTDADRSQAAPADHLRTFWKKEENKRQPARQDAKRKWKKYYNSKVCHTSFKPGDLEYRSNDASHAEDGGKLGPKWEGPYEVTKALCKGAYKLRDRNGQPLPQT